jgi:aryl-alcohol dehydrogenase-like predicted oxidoreductase
MHYRELGETGLIVSEVGLGCNRLGQENQTDEHWINLIHRAVDLGVNLFDTSESYAGGRSEEMLGCALGARDDVYVATKMSAQNRAGERDFSAARMVQSVEASLRRLHRDRIDIYQLHSPRTIDLKRFDWAEGMTRLQEQGKIGLRAVAVRTVDDGIWLIKQGLVEVLQITYNIFVTAAEERLFPLATESGVGLLCRMPLARGVLTGKFRAKTGIPRENRAHLDGDRALKRLELVNELRPFGAAYEGGLTRLALNFSLTPTAVSAIIPGARTMAQLEENVTASNGEGLPAEVWKQIVDIKADWHDDAS